MPKIKVIKLQKIAIASSVAGGVEAASLATSFSGLFAEYFHSPVGSAISAIGSQVLYPLIMAAAAVEAILSWVKVGVDRNKKNEVKTRNVVNAGIATTAFTGFSVALIGLLVAAPIFAQASSIIFMAIIGARALYNFGAGIYYKYQASKMDDGTKKDKYHGLGNQHIKSGALGLVAFAAVTAVFLLGYFVAAPVGIALNAFFTVMAVVGVATGIKKLMQMNKQEPLLDRVPDVEPNMQPIRIKRSVSAPVINLSGKSRDSEASPILHSPGRNSIFNVEHNAAARMPLLKHTNQGVSLGRK